MGIVVTLSTSSTMSAFKLLSIAFGLFSLALICEGTLKEDFCTDVSFWDVIKYTSTTAKCCDTELREECKTKTERVCEDATEIKCKTVTKDNCVTDWNIDEHGNKIWGGKEKCEPVSWEECKIVKKAVDFPAVKTNCD